MTALVPAGAKHPTVQHLRRLSGRRGARTDAGEVLVEGERALADALADGRTVSALVVAERAAHEPSVLALAGDVRGAGGATLVVADRVLETVASTVSPQPVVGAVRWGPLGSVPAGAGLVLVLAGVADPGNAGALLRVAEAAGFDAVVAADSAVDPGHPKVVRAAAGSLFRVPVVVAGPSDALVAQLRAGGVRCIGLAGDGGVPYDEVPVEGRLAVVVGSEAHGIPAATLAALDAVVTIPMAGRVESLNAAVAAGIVCFDVARRRRSPG